MDIKAIAAVALDEFGVADVEDVTLAVAKSMK